jgi:aryl-alcohol dehydrogenase-like predicted oxidoreductase
MAQLAIRWVLTHPALTSAIVGIKTPEMIESIAPAAEACLPRNDWHQVAAILEKARTEALAML